MITVRAAAPSESQTGVPAGCIRSVAGIRLAAARMAQDDRGSITPLILGFFLIALLMVAGSVMASDAFTRQRDLESTCDGAAVAASNAVNSRAVRTGTLGADLPLGAVQTAVDDYLAADAGGSGVEIVATLTADGASVLAECRVRSHIAFEALIGHSDGIDQRATASAKGLIS